MKSRIIGVKGGERDEEKKSKTKERGETEQ